MKTSLVSKNRTKKFKASLVFGYFCAGFGNSGVAGDLCINIDDLRNDTGQVLVLVLESEHQFESISNENYHSFIALRPVEGKAAAVIKSFPAGEYAVLTIHDENNDDELDTTFLGAPTEGFAFSKNPDKLAKPTFSDVSFLHDDVAHSQIHLRMQYIK